MAAGVTVGGPARDPFTGLPYPSNKPTNPLTQFGNPSSYTAAATTQAGDYDKIMQSYRDLLDRNNNSPMSSTNVTPQIVDLPRITAPSLTPYSQSADVTGSLAKLSDLATTGGYSDADIANIRERDISPIRSIYSSAQRNVDRNRALQGGYSANYGAASAKMARELSDQISDKTTAANAGIAEMVGRAKLAAAPAFASASSAEATRKSEIDRHNADIVNQINEANAARELEVNTGNVSRNLAANTSNADRALAAEQARRGSSLGAIEGMRSLYGTTPALTNLFGNQVTQAAQIGQNQQGLDQQRRRDTLGFVSRFG